MVPVPDQLQSELESLCATARWCYARGWVPATSGNFSARSIEGAGERIFITPSGLDKGTLAAEHLLEIDCDGRPVSSNAKPSAETVLHLVLYAARPQAHAILHVHTVWNTLLSGHFAGQPFVGIEGYEILKGLSDVTTHQHQERVPLIENTQDYASLEREL